MTAGFLPAVFKFKEAAEESRRKDGVSCISWRRKKSGGLAAGMREENQAATQLANGMAALEAGEIDLAIAAFCLAVKNDPLNAAAFGALGGISRDQGWSMWICPAW